MRQVLLLVILALLSIPCTGEEASKKPWQLTDEDRLARRFDPAAMRAREVAALAEGQVGPGQGRDVVVGSLHPELFLPWELWRSLISATMGPVPEVRAGFRETYELRARELGTTLPGGEEFWQRIEGLAGPSLRSREEQRSLSAQARAAQGTAKVKLESQLEREGVVSCKMLVDALEQARGEFGREAFDRFLYEIVAPDANLTSADDQVSADQLAFLAGGCQ